MTLLVLIANKPSDSLLPKYVFEIKNKINIIINK